MSNLEQPHERLVLKAPEVVFEFIYQPDKEELTIRLVVAEESEPGRDFEEGTMNYLTIKVEKDLFGNSMQFPAHQGWIKLTGPAASTFWIKLTGRLQS